MLVAGERVRVRLGKPGRGDVVYEMVVRGDDGDHVVVEGAFSLAEPVEREHFRFDPGDWFVEHFWRTRWYSVKEIQDGRGRRKGWYCDVARPAEIRGGEIRSVDLDLDLWVGDGGATVVVLDDDEFTARGLHRDDPAAARAARAALDELVALARDEFASIV